MPALWALAVIMLCSGVATLRSREDVGETFQRLKVPRPFDAPALARAFPYLELLLAVGLVQPFTVLRPFVGVAAVALFVVFLLLVLRAKGDGVSCGCFGEASAAPISGTTVARNILFLALAVMALAEGVLTLVRLGGTVNWLPLNAFGPAAWAWALVVVLLLAAAALLVGRESVPSADDGAHPDRAHPDDADLDDPPRLPFGDAVVIQNGHYVGLHQLVSQHAVVALRLSTGCGSCSSVIARLPEFQDALGPVQLRVLMPQHSPEALTPASLGAIPPELVLGDPGGMAASAVGLTRFPMAVLLGTDRLTAGGPVGGAQDVLDFLEEIRDIMTTELPAVDAAEATA
ncbi:MauE/DoxX family redox-associated membrane protein [Micrococcaceae bacterium Sec6.3]